MCLFLIHSPVGTDSTYFLFISSPFFRGQGLKYAGQASFVVAIISLCAEIAGLDHHTRLLATLCHYKSEVTEHSVSQGFLGQTTLPLGSRYLGVGWSSPHSSAPAAALIQSFQIHTVRDYCISLVSSDSGATLNVLLFLLL